MWMVLVSLVATQGSTSGPLLQLFMKIRNSYLQKICPCTNINHASSATPPPDFVRYEYFCDTGSEGIFQYDDLYLDPLWDGDGCGVFNTLYSQ